FHGRSSSIRWAGCSAIRAMTSASQACGSTLFNLAVTIRLYITAARWPPRSEPANNHDFLPRAIPRSARSAALFERQIRPSSLSIDMFPEDGCLRVYGVGEDGVTAFTRDGIECLQQIIADERAAGHAPPPVKPTE